ncbi:MAG: nucleoside recognition domain-containing protein [Peptococcia bacterium]
MVNVIWLVMIISGIILAFWQGRPEIITELSFQAAGSAVKYAIELIGVMSFWLGIMKVAEKAGLIRFLAKILRPLMKFLFPTVPPDHPALGSIVMNLSANILGLGNAATPFGLKAMEELQSLNPEKEKATVAMCTFLALNTACITILPTMVIGIRSSAGSANPTEIVGTTFFATAVGMVLAILFDRLLRRFFGGR